MEQTFSKSGSKRISIKRVLVSLLIVLTSIGASQAANKIDYNDDVIVTPTGVVNGEMTFNLRYNNPDGSRLQVTLTDNEGTRLYHQEFTDKTVSKIFKLSSELETVYLTVTDKKSNTQKRFQISSRERIVEKVLIASVH